MESLQIKTIYTISFLDSLNYGLVMPLLTTHIIMNNGNHTVAAMLVTLHLVLQTFAKHLVNTVNEVLGKKVTLLFILLWGLITNVLLGLTLSYILIICVRLLFYLTNQTQNICRAFVSENAKNRNHNDIYSVLDALGVAGFVIGPVIGGYLFSYPGGFFYVTLLMSVLSLISTLISFTLPPSSIDVPQNFKFFTSLQTKINEDLEISFQHIEKANFSLNWDIYTLKTLLTISLSAFFGKYSLLITSRYNVNSIVNGYTIAYQSILMFLSQFINIYVTQKLYKTATVCKQIVHSTFGILIATAGLCFANEYDMYLLSFIIFAIANTLFNSAWQKLCKLRSSESEDLDSTGNAVVRLVDLIMPMVIGLDCDMYGYKAIQILAVVPLIFAFMVSLLSTFNKEEDESHED